MTPDEDPLARPLLTAILAATEAKGAALFLDSGDAPRWRLLAAQGIGEDVLATVATYTPRPRRAWRTAGGIIVHEAGVLVYVTAAPAATPQVVRAALGLWHAAREARAERGAEAARLRELAQRHNWHIARMAGELGITRMSVYNRLSRAGIEIPRKWKARRAESAPPQAEASHQAEAAA